MPIQSNQTHTGHWGKIISLSTKNPTPDHKIHRTEEILHQCYINVVDAEINKNKE